MKTKKSKFLKRFVRNAIKFMAVFIGCAAFWVPFCTYFMTHAVNASLIAMAVSIVAMFVSVKMYEFTQN
jgi:putative flippase GtrA